MNKIQAVIVADSIDPRGNRITSFLLTVPQIVVKELLRHRMFSFSSSSMRAIPFNKVLQDTKENMFVPIAFQSHHSGMQGTSYLTGKEAEDAKTQWVQSGLKACEEAEKLYNLGVTKQMCSRIIEPFGYAKILVTATEWENFFELRCPKFDYLGQKLYKSRKDAIKETNASLPYDDWYSWQKMNKSQAEIHIQALAESMWDALNESTPKELKAGEWYIPFSAKIEEDKLSKLMPTMQPASLNWYLENFNALKLKVCISRAARLSYSTHDGEIDYEKDIKLHDQLLKDKHFSPFENVARVATDEEYYTHMKGKVPFGGIDKGYGIINYEYYPLAFENTDETFGMPPGENKDNGNVYGWFNNFRGFIPYRYLIENEKI